MVESDQGCISKKELEVIIYDLPVIDIPDTYSNCVSVLLDSKEYPSGFKIQWLDSNGKIVSNTQTYTVTLSGKYTLVVESDKGCISEKEVEVTIYDLPVIKLEDIYVCPEANEILSIDAGDFGDNYIVSWYNSSNTRIKDGRYLEISSLLGTYRVVVTNKITECFTEKTFSVKNYSSPLIKDVQVNNDRIYVDAYGDQPLQYSLDNIHWQKGSEFTNLKYGAYTLYVKTANGCLSKYYFGVLNLPNIIIPNRDGFNDEWQLKGLAPYPGSTIKVFDRKGRVLLDKIIDSNFTWDGKYLGRPLPTATYWYIIDLSDRRRLTGWITIKNYDKL